MQTEQHILELSHRYQLGVSDGGFVIYQLQLNQQGAWERVKGNFTKSADILIDLLLRLELQEEEKQTLADIKTTLDAMRQEFREAITIGKSR